MITPLFRIVHFKTNYNYRLSNHCFINELILVTYALISNAVEKGNRTDRGGLECFHAGYPMECVHIDILGPINPKTKSGSSYILVMIDQFTKWVELAALPAQNAELTAKAFLSHFVTTFGCPLESK